MADPRRASTGQSTAQRPVMGPPETPGRMVQPSPNMFPSLQFSPDMFSHSPFGPATAPIYPQQRLFWDPNTVPTMEVPSGLPAYQDPFALSQAEFSDSFASTATMIPSFDPGLHLPASQPYDLPPVSRPVMTSYIDGAAFPAPFHTSPRAPPPREDNPSLFLSSPARRFGNADSHPPNVSVAVAREKPAYHHQIEESRREKEAKRARKADARHPSVTRSVMEALRRPVSPIKDLRPGLKRSLTHSGVGARQPHLRQQSHVSFLDNVSVASGSSNRSRNGRISPLRPQSGNVDRSSNLSRNSKRTSVTLSIDEHGVAKTVITKVPDDGMDLDEASSDSDVSSRDDSDFAALRSQQASFAFDEEEDTNTPYVARNGLQGHSKSSSHSTMASNNSNWQSSRTSSTTSGFNARNPSARGTVQRKPVRPASEVSMLDIQAGDAQRALRAIIQDRSRSASANDDSVGSQHSVQFNSSPPVQHNQFSNFNASPTTITDPDLATPSTDRESYSSNGSTRCVCNSSYSDPNTVMIQW
jgi:hypothetical protein